MALIAVLFCLSLQRFANLGGWFRVDWLGLYLKSLNPLLVKFDKHLSLLLIIAPVLLLFLLLQFIFMWHLHSLFSFMFALAILLFCMDGRSYKRRLKDYFSNLEQNSIHAAATAVVDIVDEGVSEEASVLARAVTKGIMLKSFEEIFVNLFWFMFFGIYGVAIYFLIKQLYHHALSINSGYVEIGKLAGRVAEVMEWVPARLLGFTYALVGYFSNGFNYCIKHLFSGLSETRNFIVDSAMAALDIDVAEKSSQDENIAAIDLNDRAIIVWLTVAALVLVAVWL